EIAGIIETHRVLDRPMAFGNELVVSPKAVEPPLLVGEPRPTAPPLAACQEARLPAEPTTQNGGSRRDRVIDHDPSHVRLRLELEMHPRNIASRPDSRSVLLDGRDRPHDPEPTRKSPMQ